MLDEIVFSDAIILQRSSESTNQIKLVISREDQDVFGLGVDLSSFFVEKIFLLVRYMYEVFEDVEKGSWSQNFLPEVLSSIAFVDWWVFEVTVIRKEKRLRPSQSSGHRNFIVVDTKVSQASLELQ